MEIKNNTLVEKLCKIQGELKAPKGQTNDFGHYKYRSCEDILEAVKPLLVQERILLTITDEIVKYDSKDIKETFETEKDKYGKTSYLRFGGDRFYIKATASLTDGDKTIKVSAFARENDDKKGMDLAQLTGATSSYARKYALNGMFLIDDTKDADTMDNSKVEIKPKMTMETITQDIYTKYTPTQQAKIRDYYAKKNGLETMTDVEFHQLKSWTNEDF